MAVAHTFDPSCFEAILSKPITLPRLLDFLRGGGGGRPFFSTDIGLAGLALMD